MRKHWQGSNFPQISKISATMVPALPIDARILGILGKFDPCQVFSHFGLQHFRNIGCEIIDRDQNSPKFHAPSLPIDARILGILGKFDPCQVFSHFGLQHFRNIGCEIIDRDQNSPKFHAPSLPIDARILGILGKFDPCQCFRISSSGHLGEI